MQLNTYLTLSVNQVLKDILVFLFLELLIETSPLSHKCTFQLN